MKLIKRLLQHDIESSRSNHKVLILLGARQVGKTTLVRQMFDDTDALYLNLDVKNDRDRILSAGDLVPEAVRSYLGGRGTVILDEAQRLPEVSRMVKGWYDKDIDLKCILLGSAGLNILDKTAEALTGRNEKYYLTPLLISEVIQNEPWFSPLIDLETFQDTIHAHLDRFLVYGGYPEVVLSDQPERLLTSLYNDYLFKDVYAMDLVGSKQKLQKLLALLAFQVGSEVSTSELSTQLSVSRETVERYIGILEDTFVVYRLQAFSRNQRKELSKKSKIYFWDTGIRNASMGNFTPVHSRTDKGALWENFIVSEFMKANISLSRRQNMYFWRTYAGSEVDLVIQKDDTLEALEVKWNAGEGIRSRGAFTDRYGAEVKIIDRNNWMEYLMVQPR